MSDYATTLSSLLRVLDTVSEPSHRTKLRRQEQAEKRMARYRADLSAEAKDTEYKRSLLNLQYNDLKTQLTTEVNKHDNIRASYNTSTGEWLELEGAYQTATGLQNYEEIFNNTTNWASQEEAINAIRGKLNAYDQINDHYTQKVNDIGNASSGYTKFLDPDRYLTDPVASLDPTDPSYIPTGADIYHPVDIQGAYAESLIQMGYNPETAQDLFPNIDFKDPNYNFKDLITSPYLEGTKKTDLADVPEYLKDYIKLNTPATAGIKDLQRGLTQKRATELRNQLEILTTEKDIAGLLDPVSSDKLEEYKTEMKDLNDQLALNGGLLFVTNVGANESRIYQEGFLTPMYAEYEDYIEVVRSLNNNVPGANFLDTSPNIVGHYSQNEYQLDPAGNLTIRNPAVKGESRANTRYNEAEFAALGLNWEDDDISAEAFFYLSAQNRFTEAWKSANEPNMNETDFEYNKRAVENSNMGLDFFIGMGTPDYRSRIETAQQLYDVEWNSLKQFYNKNPFAKLVGMNNWQQATDMYTINPSYFVLDVIDPMMQTIDYYSQYFDMLTSKGIQEGSEEWNEEMRLFFQDVQLSMGGMIQTYDSVNKRNPDGSVMDGVEGIWEEGFAFSEADIKNAMIYIGEIVKADEESIHDYHEKDTALSIQQIGLMIESITGGRINVDPNVHKAIEQRRIQSDESKTLQNRLDNRGITGFTVGLTSSHVGTHVANSGQSHNASGFVYGPLSNIDPNYSSNLGYNVANMLFQSNVNTIQEGEHSIDNRNVIIDDMDWVDFVDLPTFDSGESYINFINESSTRTGVHLPLWGVSIGNDIDSFVIAETYNNQDKDKMLYHSATGPNPIVNFRDIHDNEDITAVVEERESEITNAVDEDTKNKKFLDTLKKGRDDINMIRASGMYGKGFIPNFSWIFGLLDGPVVDYHSIDTYSDIIKSIDEGSLNGGEYVNMYALPKGGNSELWSKFMDSQAQLIYQGPHKDFSTVKGSMGITKSSSIYDAQLGRYYLNFDVKGRPELMTEEVFTALGSDMQKQYLESQYSWLVDEGVLGDSGKGIATKKDMFLLPQDQRNWLTGKEALNSDIREKYQKGELDNKFVYLKDPSGGRGHFIDLKVFYDFHLEASTSFDTPINEVIYEPGSNTNLVTGYFDETVFDGYAGPTQNLLPSNVKFNIEEVYQIIDGWKPYISSDYTYLTGGGTTNYEELLQNELQNELSLLGMGSISYRQYQRTGGSLYSIPDLTNQNEKAIQALNILRNR
jgi:hypothetical protein